jgi:hypothetical protein
MFRFYDQHRDMRLDIDNMSYEELLALGDKMGTVSTALSEEALSRSLKQSIYQETDETGSISLYKDDDIKCSICQVFLKIYLHPNLYPKLEIIHCFV